MAEQTSKADRVKLNRELAQMLKAAEYRATKSDEMANLYRQGRDQAIDELRTLRPQRGHGLER